MKIKRRMLLRTFGMAARGYLVPNKLLIIYTIQINIVCPTYNKDLHYKFEYDKNGNVEIVLYVKEGRINEKEYDASNRV